MTQSSSVTGPTHAPVLEQAQLAALLNWQLHGKTDSMSLTLDPLIGREMKMLASSKLQPQTVAVTEPPHTLLWKRAAGLTSMRLSHQLTLHIRTGAAD